MKNILRISTASILVLALAAPVFAGDDPLPLVAAAAAADAAQIPAPPDMSSGHKGIPGGVLLAGTALFAGGMFMAIDGFLNNRNGTIPGHDSAGNPVFGEATATNKVLGFVGISTAFLGGTVLFFGQRNGHSAAMTIAPGRVALTKRFSW
jgi:hypothetical protein